MELPKLVLVVSRLLGVGTHKVFPSSRVFPWCTISLKLILALTRVYVAFNHVGSSFNGPLL